MEGSKSKAASEISEETSITDSSVQKVNIEAGGQREVSEALTEIDKVIEIYQGKSYSLSTKDFRK